MFTLNFTTDGDAFADIDGKRRHEIARILRELATDIENGSTGKPIFDGNGNRVGRFDMDRPKGAH